uniref:Reverse transcriptase domain-containing protein n=1 Tax=Tanacetum cinerariifolium TaxID=118510 RepID=A0A699JMV9_TANCI|nr:reverse transcriptase domain-containing protein [Tanacetum cinerariifolium]
MPIDLGTFGVIISMDWLVKHDVIIVYGEKVVRLPYENKMLIVESDKGVSRLKVISCIKARKYVERGCHLFLAPVTEKKSKEKRLEDVPVIRDFPEVFPEELPGLPPLRQDEEEQAKHLKIILELLKKERFSVHIDPAKIEAIKNWAMPTIPTEPLTKLIQKDKKYERRKEDKEAFQTLKQKLCSALILAFPKGTEDFMVYCDALLKGYGAVLMQREKLIAWIELLSDYDCEIRYHPGKANVVANAVSQTERNKPLHVRALMMTVHNDLPKQIHEAQEEAMKRENAKAENFKRLIKQVFKFSLMEHVVLKTMFGFYDLVD